MQPKIVERDPEIAIGMGGGYVKQATQQIGQLWEEFKQRMPEIEDIKPQYALGICAQQLSQISKSPKDDFVYVAALPVTTVNKIPDGMVKIDIPGGRYAVFTHKGRIADLPKTLDYIWGEWVPSGACKTRSAPDLEVYDDRFDPNSTDSEFDIYIPIE